MTNHISVQSILDYKILRHSPLFQDVDQEIIMHMLASMQREKWPRGYSMTELDQSNRQFHLLLKGRVKTGRHHLSNGRELTLFLLGPGDGFNVLSLIDGAGHDLHVNALDKVEVLTTSRQNWIDWLEQYPALRASLAKVAAHQIEHLTELASELALDDAMTRLVHLLLRYFNHTEPGKNLIKDLPQEELAHMIGTVRPVLARMLAELKTEGVIGIEGRELQVRNMQKLIDKANRHLDILTGD